VPHRWIHEGSRSIGAIHPNLEIRSSSSSINVPLPTSHQHVFNMAPLGWHTCSVRSLTLSSSCRQRQFLPCLEWNPEGGSCTDHVWAQHVAVLSLIAYHRKQLFSSGLLVPQHLYLEFLVDGCLHNLAQNPGTGHNNQETM